MNAYEFQTQIDRLKNVYGEKAYPEERVKIFWTEVRDFPAAWFARQVDSWIGALKFPPLMTEISGSAIEERSRLHEIAKKREFQDFLDWRDGTYMPKEAKFNFEIIRMRMYGEVGDEEWACFIETLNRKCRTSRE